jgi:hypothetical protein
MQWNKPDTPENPALFTICHQKQSKMPCLITAANVPAGSTYADALTAITQEPLASNDLNQEDLYVLVLQGMDKECTATAVHRAFVRPKGKVEHAGWSRTTRGIKEWTAGLGYAFEATKEGMEWLTKLGITKKMSGNPLAWEWPSKAVQDAMRVPKWMEYGEWVKELVFSDTEAGGYLKRYLVEQGSNCRASQMSKKGKKSMDVEEAGKRSVCQWLLWTFPPAKGWNGLDGLYGRVPSVCDLRAKVLDCITKGLVFGDKYDRERDGIIVYSLQELCKLGVPLAWDCGGVLPSTFKNTLKGYMTLHPYIMRTVCARVLGVQVAEPEAQAEGAGGGIALAINKAMVYNIVDPENEFKAPSREEIAETGLKNLWTLEKGGWSEKNGGVELVWFNMPLPEVVSGEEAAAYEFTRDPVRESEEVQTAIETGVKLLTGAGVMVVVGPMGVPPLDLVAAGEVFHPLKPEIKSVMTVI